MYGFGKNTKKGKREKKEKKQRDGNNDDVAVFANKLVSFAKKRKVRLIMPGIISYNGAVSKISAIIVGHGAVVGVYCAGYGGLITVGTNTDTWTQRLNGVTKAFGNLLRTCDERSATVESIMEANGVPVKMHTVPVFTTPGVKFYTNIQNVYTTDTFFHYLEKAKWVTSGDLDMDKIADTLQSMVPVDELKAAGEAAKEQKKQEKKDSREKKKQRERTG